MYRYPASAPVVTLCLSAVLGTDAESSTLGCMAEFIFEAQNQPYSEYGEVSTGKENSAKPVFLHLSAALGTGAKRSEAYTNTSSEYRKPVTTCGAKNRIRVASSACKYDSEVQG